MQEAGKFNYIRLAVPVPAFFLGFKGEGITGRQILQARVCSNFCCWSLRGKVIARFAQDRENLTPEIWPSAKAETSFQSHLRSLLRTPIRQISPLNSAESVQRLNLKQFFDLRLEGFKISLVIAPGQVGKWAHLPIYHYTQVSKSCGSRKFSLQVWN